MAGTLSKPFSVTKAADQSENIDQMFYELYQTVKELSASLTTVTKAAAAPVSAPTVQRFATIGPYSSDNGVWPRTIAASPINGIGGPFIQGSVIFAGPSGLLAQNNANFFYDNTLLGLALGTNILDPDSLGTKFILLGASPNRADVYFVGNTSDADVTNEVRINFGANSNSGAADKRLASINVLTDGSTATNRGGRLSFRVKADGGGTAGNEVLRIDQTGLVWAGVGAPATQAIAIGATPALSGNVRSTYGSPSLTSRNRTNTADVSIIGIGGIANDDFIEIGDNSQHAVTIPLGLKFYPGAAVKMVLFTSGGLALGSTTDPGSGNMSIANPGTLTLGAISAASVLFTGVSGVVSQDNANFSYNSSTATLTIAGNPALKLGSNPAGSGIIRLTYATQLVTHARLNASDVGLLGMGNIADDDYIEFGDNSQHAVSKPLGIKFYPGSGFKLQLDTNGNLTLKSTVIQYNGINTAGWGVPAIYGSGRSTGQSGAVASVAAYTVGVADGSFWVSMNILITAFTAGTISGVVTYTDESGASRSLTMNFSSVGGVLGTTAGAAGAFEGVPLHIRAKASTAITCTTTVSVFTGTYNVEGAITQIA